MQIRLCQFLKCFGVALLYAALGCMLARTTGVFLWQLHDGSMEGWSRFVFYDKLLLHAWTVLVAGFAARTFRPTWIWGIATAALTACMFRLAELALFMHQSGGWLSYRDPLLITVIMSLILGMVVGVILVWKRYRDYGSISP